jgi:hypothetical protein
VRIALVTAPPDASSASSESPVAGYTAELVPHLAAIAEVELFVAPACQGEDAFGRHLRPLSDLDPRAHDQVLYQLGDAREHGFMLPAIRALGGTVVLHVWSLARAACGAYPALERGGLAGWRRALAEGGVGEARAWMQRDASAAAPALNRSAVRFGDAFLVHVGELGPRILAERNERTPIAVLPPPIAAAAPAGVTASTSDAWAALARAYIEALEGFPHARSARRSLVALAFRARTAAREARAAAPAAGART